MNVKSFLFIVLATSLGAITTSCDNDPVGKNVIITVNDSKTDKVFALFKPFDGSGSIRDTLLITDNKAIYPVPEKAGELSLTTPNSSVKVKPISDSPIVFEANKIILLLDGESTVKIEANFKDDGTDYNVLKSDLNKELKEALTEVQALNITIDKKTREMIAIGDPTVPKLHELDVEIQTLKSTDRRAIYLNYVKQNLTKPLAAYMITYTNVDSLGVYYNQLSDEVKNGMLAPALERLYQIAEDRQNARNYSELVIEGTLAPNIVCNDINNNPFDLSKIKAKYTLVEFWGSWCPYCVKAIPEMKEYYEKYKGNLEIVSVACRDSDAVWRKAVNEHQLPWLQIIDARIMNGQKIVAAYGVLSYPTLFLLDENKLIVKKFIGAEPELFATLDKLLGKKK